MPGSNHSGSVSGQVTEGKTYLKWPESWRWRCSSLAKKKTSPVSNSLLQNNQNIFQRATRHCNWHKRSAVSLLFSGKFRLLTLIFGLGQNFGNFVSTKSDKYYFLAKIYLDPDSDMAWIWGGNRRWLASPWNPCCQAPPINDAAIAYTVAVNVWIYILNDWEESQL